MSREKRKVAWEPGRDVNTALTPEGGLEDGVRMVAVRTQMTSWINKNPGGGEVKACLLFPAHPLQQAGQAS